MSNHNDSDVHGPDEVAANGAIFDSDPEPSTHLVKEIVKPVEPSITGDNNNDSNHISLQNLPGNDINKEGPKIMADDMHESNIEVQGDVKDVPKKCGDTVIHDTKKSLQNGAEIEEANLVQSNLNHEKTVEVHNNIEASSIETQSKTETGLEAPSIASGEKSNVALSSGTPPAKPVLCLRLIINSGSTAEFNVNPDSTVREITSYIHANWPPQWESDQVSDPGILRLIYQGRFLHSSITMKALNLQEGHTVVMHLIPRETLPESNANEEKKKAKREREGHCCCVM